MAATITAGNLAISKTDLYMHRTMLRRTIGDVPMIAAIERALSILFAPLARELDRMPAQAFRHLRVGL
jgi:hypothetical protein